MGYRLDEKIRDLRPYDPIRGEYPIRLDANESFLKPPAELLSKIGDAVAGVSFNRYPDPFARELCESFADYYGAGAENVTAGNGSDELISVIENAFVMKGEPVLTLSPDFSMYRFYGSLDETNCVEYRKKPDFSVDIGELIELAGKSDARLLVFSNPCNPTGRGIGREELRRLIHSVGALVVVDEAYMDFWDQSLLGEVNEYDNLVVLRTLSKAFGMASIRLGFAAANPALTAALRAVKSPYNVNACTQKIGTVLLREHTWARSCVSEIKASQKELFTALRRLERSNPEQMTVCDSVTNFTLVRFSDCGRIFEELLKAGIVVRNFGGYLRITAGAPKENAELIRRLEAIL